MTRTTKSAPKVVNRVRARSGNSNPTPVAKKHLFQPGNKMGRKKGTKNKFSIKLKEAILEAAALSGEDGKGKNGAVGYLKWLSRAEPAVFGRMLEKVMPLQVDVKDTTERERLTPAEAAERLQELGVPVPPLLTSAASLGRAVAVTVHEQEEAEFDRENGLDDGDAADEHEQEQED